MTDENETTYSGGDTYDNAIVAIAIGGDSDIELDGEVDGEAFDDLLTGMTAEIHDDDIDHEETWLRRCTGDIQNGMQTNSGPFGSLPPEIQMKLVLDLREREKATLLENLRECSSVVERLKAQLFESEDRRMELEDELDTENTEVQEMKREFKEMKEAHKCRIKDIERIAKEMLVQRERLSAIIEQKQRSPSIASSTSRTSPTSREHSETSGDDDESKTMSDQQESISPPKSEFEIEFERKLQVSPQYREEFERFKEFQLYYQAGKRNQQASNDGSSDGNEFSTALPLGEEYRKMLEFQLAYERILWFTKKHRKTR